MWLLKTEPGTYSYEDLEKEGGTRWDGVKNPVALRNLKAIYREADQPERLLGVLNRMLLVSPEAHGELRERGLLYQRLECHRAALKDLSDYAALEPDAADADEVRAKMLELSQLCARLN